MAAWSNKMMPIPVDADSGIRESFITAVKRDVVINFAFVFLRVVLRARHARFFVGGEKENEIAFGLDVCGVERANGGEQCFDISRVIANARRVDAALAHSRFDFQARLKDRVQDRKSTRLNSSHGYISYAVFCLKKKR